MNYFLLLLILILSVPVTAPAMAQEYVPDSARESLVDIRDVKLDSSMEQADRVRSFIQQVKNPYRFKVGDVVVNVAYTNGGATLNECFADMLSLL